MTSKQEFGINKRERLERRSTARKVSNGWQCRWCNAVYANHARALECQGSYKHWLSDKDYPNWFVVLLYLLIMLLLLRLVFR